MATDFLEKKSLSQKQNNKVSANIMEWIRLIHKYTIIETNLYIFTENKNNRMHIGKMIMTGVYARIYENSQKIQSAKSIPEKM